MVSLRSRHSKDTDTEETKKMKKLVDLTEEEVRDELEKRKIVLEMAEDDDEIARNKLREWILENESDPDSYNFEYEDKIDEEGSKVESSVDESEKNPPTEDVDMPEDQPGTAQEDENDESVDAGDCKDESSGKEAEDTNTTNGETEKHVSGAPDFEIIEKDEIDEANKELAAAEADDEKTDDTTDLKLNDESENADKATQEKEMTEGPEQKSDAAVIQIDEDFSDTENDISKEVITPAEDTHDTDILELDYDDPDEPLVEKVSGETDEKIEEVEDVLKNVPFLWISGLEKSMKAADIREEFEKQNFGERPLRSCKVAVGKKNGGTAFAFCELATPEYADRIIELYHDKILCGSTVQITKVESDPTLPKPKQTEQTKRKLENETLLVPKRLKKNEDGKKVGGESNIINLKKKAEEQKVRKGNERMKMEFQKEVGMERQLKRESDELRKKLKRKIDDVDRLRRENNRNRDELRKIEADIRREENVRMNMKEDVATAKRHLDKVMHEIRSLDMSARSYQEEEQRHRIQLERKRLEDEKRRFAEEREKLERERRDANHRPGNSWNTPTPTPSMPSMPSRSSAQGFGTRGPQNTWPNARPAANAATANSWYGPSRTIISYGNEMPQRSFGATRGRGAGIPRR